MNHFFNLNNKVFTILGKIGDAILLNIMWLLGCIPVVTVGAATGALYEGLRYVVLEEEGNLFRVFWNVYKRNFAKKILQTVVLELIIFGVIFLVVWGYMYQSESVWIGAVYMSIGIPVVVIVCMAIYTFLMLTNTEMKIVMQLKVAFVLTLKHFFWSLLLLLLLAAAVLAVEYFPYGLLLIPSTYCWIAGKLIEKTADKYPQLIKRVNALELI